MLQMKHLAQVEKNINELGPITEYLKANPDGKGLMERVLDGLTVNEVYNEPIHFQCRCGRDRFCCRPHDIKRRR